MPSGPRIRSNSEFGLTTDNPLTIGATSFNSARLSLMPVVSSAHAIVTLDPRAINGEPEIVTMTAHTAAATVATITRGQYGTAARAHPVGTEWIHAPLDEDFIEILTSVTRPTDPYRGQMIFETDTNRFVNRTTADTWQQLHLSADPPSCRVYRSTSQGYTTGVPADVTFDSERWDTDSMHSTSVNTNRITFNTAGLYTVTFHGSFVANAAGNRYVSIRLNGTTYIAVDLRASTGGNNLDMSIATVYKFSVNDYITVEAFQSSGTTPLNLQAQPNYSPEFTATWIGRG